MDLETLLPLLAAVFAIPQFLPQLEKVRRTGDVRGLSPSGIALTCIHNAAWLVYFVSDGQLVAIVPNGSVIVITFFLSVALRGQSSELGVAGRAVAMWAAVLLGAFVLGGTKTLGLGLAVAFAVQVVPSLWAAYTTERPTGLSGSTWLLVFAELLCWGLFGLLRSDRVVILLGASGVVSSSLMVSRAFAVAREGAAHIPLPRSRSPERLVENLAARNVELTPEQIERLDELEDGHATHPKHLH